MPEIENDAMTLGNRTVVSRCRVDEIKQLIRAGPRDLQLSLQFLLFRSIG
jgi:hypothetical protein